MRAACLALFFVGVISIGSAAPIQPAVPQGPVLVSYKANAADVRVVLRELFKQAKVNGFSIDPEVQGTVQFTASKVQFDTALTSVLKQVGATFSAENNEYHVFSAQQKDIPGADAPGYEAKRASFSFVNDDLEVVVTNLFMAYDQSFVMSSKIQGKVSLILNNVPLAVALDRIGRACGFTYELKDTVYTLLPSLTLQSASTEISRPLGLQEIEKAAAPASTRQKGFAFTGQLPVLTFTDRKASDLFAELFKSAQTRVKVMPGLDQKLSGFFGPANFAARLYELKTLANAKVTLEKGVYVVRPR
jgi:type II secretory pathway component GspD/PulD (secretin)